MFSCFLILQGLTYEFIVMVASCTNLRQLTSYLMPIDVNWRSSWRQNDAWRHIDVRQLTSKKVNWHLTFPVLYFLRQFCRFGPGFNSNIVLFLLKLLAQNTLKSLYLNIKIHFKRLDHNILIFVVFRVSIHITCKIFKSDFF